MNHDPGTSRRPDWLTPAVVGAMLLSAFSGIAQFSVTAVAGDVGQELGHATETADLSSQLGLTATTLGVALAIIRLASLPALAGGTLADRHGRRPVALTATVVGLALTAAASLSWTFWVWVALVALARPWLSTVNQVSSVMAAEEVNAKGRAWAVAAVGGAYGLGAGVMSVTRGLAGTPSFRLVLAGSLIPLLAMLVVRRLVHEPDLYRHVADQPNRLRGHVPPRWRATLWWYCLVLGATGAVTGPGFTYLFVFGERVLDASPAQMSLLVLAAGPIGGAGLLAGRAAADRWGRRPTCAATMVGTAIAVAVAYSDGFGALTVGYLAGIAAAGAFGPAAGAMLAEAFPTSMRATAAGWATVAGVLGGVFGLAVFGALADRFGDFGPAAAFIAVPVALTAVAFRQLPETRGHELDEQDRWLGTGQVSTP